MFCVDCGLLVRVRLAGPADVDAVFCAAELIGVVSAWLDVATEVLSCVDCKLLACVREAG